MFINSISFSGYARRATKQEEARLDKVEKDYTTGSEDDKKLVELAHDVFQIRPWQCSEGAMLEKNDIKTADKFMKALRESLDKGNKKLAYAVGRVVLQSSPAGKANNADFDDLPLGEIKTLHYDLVDAATKRNPKTGSVEYIPEYLELSRKIDKTI